MSTLRVVPELCTGCRSCVCVCSFRHTGLFGLDGSRIRVEHEPERCRAVPVVCSQCDDAPCAAACPVEAIGRDAAGAVCLLKPDECAGCGECVEACPHGALWLDGEGKPVKCDLCGGEAWCTRVCFPGALTLGEEPR